jgi:hypothetical protein
MVQMLKAPSSQALGILGIEEIKQLNMVDFLIRHYSLDFSKGGISVSAPGGGQYCCLSPFKFKDERNPSFFVCEVGGHWLFKDFYSSYGGSLIDFVFQKEQRRIW